VGLAADLSYVHRRPNPFQRAMQTVTSTRAGAWVVSKTLARVDRAVTRRTGGRTITELGAGIPVLRLTTTGRRSGQPRSTHLIAIPFRDTLALLGTNFGQASTPTWVLNLEADSRAKVMHKGVTVDVVARPATEEERAEVLAASKHVYGGYLKYQQRIRNRSLRIFVLESP
jgi:deazaflavin-dependent oxidoreductase (nitroreductase family)